MDILCTYQEVKIKFGLLDNFWPDCVALKISLFWDKNVIKQFPQR